VISDIAIQYVIYLHGFLLQLRRFETQDGVYDCAWSEVNPNQLVSACANGALKLWDITTRDDFPIQKYHEHTQEVAGVNWNLVQKDVFATASWDGTVKIWRPDIPHSVATLTGHAHSVYNAVWCTRHTNLLASCSGDRTVKVWDLNAPQTAVTTIPAHTNEVLALDWNKYNEFQLVSGSVDTTIKIWVRIFFVCMLISTY